MKLGISSSLLGINCNHDGSNSKCEFVTKNLLGHFHFVPFCSEEVAFFTPREKIKLVKENGNIVAKTARNNINVTNIIKVISNNLLEGAKKDNLCGFILKSGSATSGLENIEIYDENNRIIQKDGVGIFTQVLKEKYPFLPLIDEKGLGDNLLRENFFMQVFAYKDLMDFLSKEPSLKDLIKFHTEYKYLIYAKSQDSYRQLGNIVANCSKISIKKSIDAYKLGFLRAMALKASLSNTYNVLLHIYGYFKDDLTKDEKIELLFILENFKQGIVPLATATNILKLYIIRFNITYLKSQKIFEPYPPELAASISTKIYK